MKSKNFKSRQSDCAVSKPPSQDIGSSDESDLETFDTFQASKEKGGVNSTLTKNTKKQEHSNTTLTRGKKKRRISSSSSDASSSENEIEEATKKPVNKTKEKLRESLISYTPPQFQKDDSSFDEDDDALPQLPFKKITKSGILPIIFFFYLFQFLFSNIGLL